MLNLTQYLLGRKSLLGHLLVLLFLVASGYCLWNARYQMTFGDYAPVYAGTRCVVHGTDPYKTVDAQAQLDIAGADKHPFAGTYWARHSLVYPPLTYYVMAPMALLDYPLSCKVWFALLGAALIAGAAAAIRLSPLPARTFVLCGVSAILWGSGVLVRLGQISALVIGLVAISSMLFLARRHLLGASCLFFLAAALKPQLVIPLLLYFCLPKKTRKFALSTLVVFAAAFGLSGLLLASRPQTAHWPADLAEQLHSSATVSAAPVDKLETGVVNLQALTALFSANPKIYEALSTVVIAALVVVLAVGLRRLGANPIRDWLAVAAVSILTLVLVYHRSYDMRMVMLTLPALALLWRAAPKIAAVVSFLSCFLLYSTALKMVNRLSPHLTHAQTHSLVFRLLIERQQALFVFFTAIAWVVVPFLVRRLDLDIAPRASTRPAGVHVAV
jgi:hypothetical protein